MVLLGLAVEVGLVLAGDVRGDGDALGQLEVTLLEGRDESKRELVGVAGGETLERVDLLELNLGALVLGSDARREDTRAELFRPYGRSAAWHREREGVTADGDLWVRATRRRRLQHLDLARQSRVAQAGQANDAVAPVAVVCPLTTPRGRARGGKLGSSRGGVPQPSPRRSQGLRGAERGARGPRTYTVELGRHL